MNTNRMTVMAKPDRTLVTAAEWFAGGQRVWYIPEAVRVVDGKREPKAGALKVFERVADPRRDTDHGAVWLTMLPGFPDGSYGWAQVDRLLGADLGPRLYVEPVGQGDSDKPRDYSYSTYERANLVEALWRHHQVRRTVVVTFDYTSLALLELLRRQADRPPSDDRVRPEIVATFMVNGGLFADAHSHPWLGTPLLRTPLGALGTRQWQTSPRVFAASLIRARMYSPDYRPTENELEQMWSAVTRRDGAAFAHNGAGFVREHRRNGARWNLATIARDLGDTVAFYLGGSEQDAYEHRQIPAARQRVPRAEIVTFPGGHLTTAEHPHLLAAKVRDIAVRHGVGSRHGPTRTPARAERPDEAGEVG